MSLSDSGIPGWMTKGRNHSRCVMRHDTNTGGSCGNFRVMVTCWPDTMIAWPKHWYVLYAERATSLVTVVMPDPVPVFKFLCLLYVAVYASHKRGNKMKTLTCSIREIFHMPRSFVLQKFRRCICSFPHAVTQWALMCSCNVVYCRQVAIHCGMWQFHKVFLVVLISMCLVTGTDICIVLSC
jgi:hypothetical protein